jgi:isopentenyl-diphosphate delta-isomerase
MCTSRNPLHHHRNCRQQTDPWESDEVTDDQEEEMVVLIDDHDRPIGQAPKHSVHGARTPRHLGFSCYGFDRAGRILVTRRAATKATFPGVWTNTCCGHPAPGERPEMAAARRLWHELGLQAAEIRVALPDFAYRAAADGIEENELCPVLTCVLDADPTPNPDEVAEWAWWTWDRFVETAQDPEGPLSPWARLQAPLLDRLR